MSANTLEFYQTKLNEAKALVQQGKLMLAKTLLDQELSMPYVPQPYLKMFNELNDSILASLRQQQTPQILAEEQIMSWLFLQDLNKVAIAVSQLARLNMHRYASELRNFLELDRPQLTYHQAVVMELMIEQKVNVSVQWDAFHQINPSLTKSIFESAAVVEAYQTLQQLFYKSPSELQAALSELNHYLLLTYGLPIEDGKSLANDLAKIVEFYFDQEVELTSTQQVILAQLRGTETL